MTSNRRRFRRQWLKVHSTLALSVGLLFVLMGITGSLNVIGDSLDRWLNPELAVTARPGAERSPDALMAAAQAAHPRRMGSWRLEFPDSPDRPAVAWYDKPIETSDESYAPLMVALDPYTGQVLASRFWGHTLASWFYRLHSQLLLGEIGGALVGLLGMALLAALVTGLRLWLPSRQRLQQALTVKPKAGFKRRVFDLHRVTGVYGIPILATAALTGLHMAYPSVLETLLSATDFGHHEESVSETIVSSVPTSATPLNLAQAILLARGLFPNAAVDSITTPRTSNGMFRVDFRRPGEHHALTAVWVDPYSGQIRQVRNSANFSPTQRRLNAIRLLHNGSLLGPAGQWLWFVGGFTPLALYLTGMIHWLHKHRIEVEPLIPRLPEKYAGRCRQCTTAMLSMLATAGLRMIHVTGHTALVLAGRAHRLWLEHRRRKASQHE